MAKKTTSRKLWSKQNTYTKPSGEKVLMDSTWETMLAMKLDDLGLSWERHDGLVLEYRTVRGRKRKYIPDFYLPDHDVYIEVKGYWTDAARHKMKDVQERNPVKILILESVSDISKVNEKLSEMCNKKAED